MNALIKKGQNDLTGDDELARFETRIEFPGGSIQVIETTDGNFWAHIVLNKPTESEQGGRIKSVRLDCLGKDVRDMDVGDLDNPNLYHVAVLIEKGEKLVKQL